MKTEKRKYPFKIRAGYSLLKIGSVLLFIMASLILLFIFLSLTFFFEEEFDSSPLSLVNYAIEFSIAVFYILAAIGGFSFANHRKALVWITAFAAVIFLGIFLFDIVTTVFNFVRGTGSADDIVELVMSFLAQGIYTVGWGMSKDYFED